MTVESILDIAFSVTTAVIAGVALFQTKKQIQMLGDTFEKRAKESAELVKLIPVIEVIDTTYNKIVGTKAEEKLIESINL